MNRDALFIVLSELRDRLTVSFNSLTWEDEDKHDQLALVVQVSGLIDTLDVFAHDDVFGDSTITMLVTNKRQECLQRDNNLLIDEIVALKNELRETKLQQLARDYDTYVHYTSEEDVSEDGTIEYYYTTSEESRGEKSRRTRTYNLAVKKVHDEYK